MKFSHRGTGKIVPILLIVALAIVVVGVAFYAGYGPTSTNRVLRIIKVYTDSVDAPGNSTYYLIMVNASDNGQTAWHFDPSFFILTSTAQANYQINAGYNETSLLSKTDIQAGKSEEGFLAFELPRSGALLRLQYSDPSGSTMSLESIPQVSGIASRFNYNAYLAINGTGPWAQGGGVNGWGYGSLIINGVIENNTLVFFSGQTIQVNLWFEYLKRPVDPTTITIQSVSTKNGFTVVGTDRPLPFNMIGWGAQAGLVVLLKDPPGQHTGNVDLTVNLSS